ncbi:MAG: hypothetical protein AABX07_00820, partial [Nanoarchaeota archaeon]
LSLSVLLDSLEIHFGDTNKILCFKYVQSYHQFKFSVGILINYQTLDLFLSILSELPEAH